MSVPLQIVFPHVTVVRYPHCSDINRIKCISVFKLPHVAAEAAVAAAQQRLHSLALTMKNRRGTVELQTYSLPFPRFGPVHFRCASAHCSDCSPHEHDVLKPCEPIITAIGVGPTHGNSIDQIHVQRMEKERGHWVFYKPQGSYTKNVK